VIVFFYNIGSNFFSSFLALEWCEGIYGFKSLFGMDWRNGVNGGRGPPLR